MAKTGERARRNTIGSTPPRQTQEIVKPTRKSLRNPTHKATCIHPTCNTKDASKENTETNVELEQPQKTVKSTRKPDWRKRVTPKAERVTPKAKMTKQLELKQPQKETCDVITIDDDELLEPKLEDSVPLPKFSVQGYEVKRRNGEILEAIFEKHGNIAAECLFNESSNITQILEVVCEVVRQIQTGNVSERTTFQKLMNQVLDAEAVNINVSWLRAHLEAIKRRNETAEKYTSLMGIKKDVSMIKKAAKEDKREISEELEAVQQRFDTAKRCAEVFELFEKNVSDHILEFKAELDAWVNSAVI